MSNLIKRFKEDLQLAGYAKRSIESYVSSVLRLQRFYNKPLEDITEEQLRQYWLCCQSEFGWSAASLRISYAGIQHFFSRTLVRTWNIFNEIKWKREQKLPTILSLQEVRKIIYALPTLQSHTFYLTLYSLGLRLREATTLQVRTAGMLTVPAGTLVEITVMLDPGSHVGESADWWAGYEIGGGWFTYIYPTGWGPEIFPAYQGGLFALSPFAVLSEALAPGDYDFYMAVDTTPDGELSFDTLWYDYVRVVVE